MTVKVLDHKPYQSLDDALYLCRELMEDADFPTVKRWREAGGKVLGHFQGYFPEEIPHAAGMLPVKKRGRPRRVSVRISVPSSRPRSNLPLAGGCRWICSSRTPFATWPGTSPRC